MQKNTGKLRITLGTFDFVKGLAMIFIVLGHITYFHDPEQLLFYAPFIAVIQSMGFLMPAFWMISSFTFKEKPVKKMLKESFNHYIVPYLWTAGVLLIVYFVMFYVFYRDWVGTADYTMRLLLALVLGIPKVGKLILGFEASHCPVIWFFLASFIAHNLLNGILKVKKTAAQVTLTAICVVAGYVLVIRDINYFCIPQGLLATGCCYIGFLLKKHRLLEKGLHKTWVYLALLPIALAHLIWGKLNICLGLFHYGLLDYFGGCCAAVLFLLAGVAISQRQWKGLRWIETIGVYSFWIMCVHAVENECMHWYLLIDAIPDQHISFLMEIVLKAFLITAGCVILKQLQKTKYRRRLLQHGK